MMRVIVHSVHSQVPSTIEELRERPRTVLSLDSHLDVSLGDDDDVYPVELRSIAKRTSAHTDIRRVLESNAGSSGRLIVAIPEAMFLRHVQEVEADLPEELRLADESEATSSVAGFLADERGIETFQSPPRSLGELAGEMGGRSGPWVLDIDVDYMEDMQDECYTSIIGARRGVLQSSKNVLSFVRRVMPETITISEVKTSALRSETSCVARFLGQLRNTGYEVEEKDVATSDSVITRGISDTSAFYSEVARRLVIKHRREMMGGDLQGFRREEKALAMKFFEARGYSYQS